MNVPTATYGWTTEAVPCSCGYVAPVILKLLERLRIGRVLDIGAGNGALCAMMSGAGHDVVGMEHDREGCELAAAHHPQLHFHHYGVQDDPALLLATEPAFDAVVSTEVIEHLFAPHLLPRYARAVLVPRGHLILSTPYHGYLKNLALSLVDGWDAHHTPLWHGGHIKFWSRSTLSRLLREQGFDVIGFYGVGRLAYLWKSMVLVARKTAG